MKILPILTAASLCLTTLAFAKNVGNPPGNSSNKTLVTSMWGSAWISCSGGDWQHFSKINLRNRLYFETSCSPLQVTIDALWSLASVDNTASYDCPQGTYAQFNYGINFSNQEAWLTFEGCVYR